MGRRLPPDGSRAGLLRLGRRMSDKRILFLNHAEARRRAVAAVAEAPEGYRVTVEPPPRSLDQNAAQWPILEAFSKQLTWPVNGEMVSMEPEDWKDVLTAAFRQETTRLAMGLNGGVVMLGMRTSKMKKPEFSEWLEFLHATAALRGVTVYEEEHS
jgi:xanthine/CO dehydrogenase XdhC/CoxF family maturation factor